MVGYAAMISFPEFQKDESWTSFTRGACGKDRNTNIIGFLPQIHQSSGFRDIRGGIWV